MKNQLLRLLALLAWWLTVAIFATEQTVAMAQSAGQPVTWEKILPLQLAGWLLWVPLTAFLMALVAKYPLSSRSRLLNILVLSLAVGVCCAAKGLLVILLNENGGFWYDGPVSISTALLDSVRNNFVLSWLIVGVAHAIFYYDNDRKNQIVVAQLKADLSTVKLEALAARLNPHFMFNTLNTILELIHIDPNGAETMLLGLAALLRRSLDSTETARIPLHQELAFIDQYVAIQKVRFGTRLNYQTNIEEDALNCQVPMMLLQPLIENAIEHGVAASAQPSSVILSCRLSNQSLIMSVDSPYFEGNQTRTGFGIGLSATQARLKLDYSDRQTLSVNLDVPNRILVTIVIISADFLAIPSPQSSTIDARAHELSDA